MATYTVSVAAATAVIGYDLVQNEPWTVSENARVLTGIGIMGSAAALDTIVDCMAGLTRVCRLYNRTTGMLNKDDLMELMAFIPAGAKISLPVVDVPATNPINAIIELEDL